MTVSIPFGPTPSSADLLGDCTDELDLVTTDGNKVCYDSDTATTAPRPVSNAKLYEQGDVRFIQFTIEGYGPYVTLSADDGYDNWTDPLPSHRPGNHSTATSSPYDLVNLRTPMTEIWYDKLTDNGTRIHHYLAHGWYLMDATNASTPPEEFAFVNRTTDFEPSTKLQEGLTSFDGTVPIVVRSMPNRPGGYADSLDALRAEDATIVDEHPEINMTEANISSTQLADLTGYPSISRIEYGNYTATTYMSNIRTTTGAQEAHDSSRDLDGFTGHNVTGMVMDVEHTKGNDKINSSIAGYWPEKSLIQGDGPDHGSGVHGAKVFAIAHASDGPDASDEGMAPNASSVVAQALPLSRVKAADDLRDEHGGTVQSHSWGIPTKVPTGQDPYPSRNAYDLLSVEGDLIGYEADVLAVQAMANDGPGQAASEAIAKNGLSIGGLYHFNDDDRTDNNWTYKSEHAESFQSDIGRASTGPTWDCRTKPDLVGPFDMIDTYKADGETASFQHTSGATPVVAGSAMLTEEMYRKGLFMNETDADTEGDPAPATLKALAVNSAYSFTVDQTWNSDEFGTSGCGPSIENPQPRESRDVQGWGQPNLSVYDEMGPNTYVINETTHLDSGDTMNYTVNLPDWADGLAVTLAWTDPPGTPLTNTQPIAKLTNLTKNQTVADEPVHRQLVNDLNLEVQGPDGNVFPGNHGMGNSSTSEVGDHTIDADTVNNLENVVLTTNGPKDGESGDWYIEVQADDIQLPHDPGGDGHGQPFSLVIRPLDGESSYSCSCSGGGGSNLDMTRNEDFLVAE